MTKLSKKTKMFMAAAFALGVAGAGVGAIQAANAATTNNSMNNLVNAIAAKFNLNASDVQQVFDEERSKMEAQHQQAFADRLKLAVTEGKITQDQADKIIAKQQEVKAFMESLKDKTEAERHTAMKTEMDSLKQWATDKNIPQQFLMFVGGHGPGPMMGKGSGWGFRHNESAGLTNQ